MLIIYFILLRLCVSLNDWPRLSFESEVRIRSQRDLSYSRPIDQTTPYGMSLKTLFDKHGYTPDSLSYITTMLEVGLSVLSVDLYYNNYTSNWQLCPAPYPINGTIPSASSQQTLQWNGNEYTCQPDFTPDLLMRQITTFLSETNTNMDANYLQILYRLHQFDYPPTTRNSTTNWNQVFGGRTSGYENYGNLTLGDTVSSLGLSVFTPADLETFQEAAKETTGTYFYNDSSSAFPSVRLFVFDYLKRVTVMVAYDDVTNDLNMYNITDNDKLTIFFNGDTVNMTNFIYNQDYMSLECLNYQVNNLVIPDTSVLESRALNTHFRYIYDSEDVQFDDFSFRAMVRCGFSPILNSTNYEINGTSTDEVGDIINNFISYSFWSWEVEASPNQPDSYNDTDIPEEFNDDGNVRNNDEAIRCVVVDADGWTISNCYDDNHYACQNIYSPISWHIPESRMLYFEAFTDNRCPVNYTFGVPRLSLEMLGLIGAIADSDLEYPVWVDVNDITVVNCFVTGGPYAECPYQRTVSTRALAGLIAPSFVVAIVVLFLLFLEKIFRLNPIQTNRKRYWKKKITEYNKKNDYEGVPS